MTKRFFITWAIVFSVVHLPAQKPVIDSSTYDNWPLIQGHTAQISDDGNYSFGDKGAVKECNSNWELKLPAGAIESTFLTINKKNAIVFKIKDSLCFITLKQLEKTIIPHVGAYKIAKGNKQNIWLAYTRADNPKELIVQRLPNGKIMRFPSVKDFFFSDNGKTLAVAKEEGNSGKTQSVSLVSLEKDATTTIWNGEGFERLLIDSSASMAALLLKDPGGKRSIWCYNANTKKTSLLVDDSSPLFENRLAIDYLNRVSHNRKYLFFYAKEIKTAPTRKKETSTLNLWSYLDEQIQPVQLADMAKLPSYILFAVDLKDDQVIKLMQEDGSSRIFGFSEDDHNCLIEEKSGKGESYWNEWNKTGLHLSYILDLNNKTKTLLNFSTPPFPDLSPDGRYVVWYDRKIKNFFSYEIATGIYRNITAGIHTDWVRYGYIGMSELIGLSRGVAGWVDDGASVLLYDKYDIWKVDLSGRKPAINITNRYGKKKQMVFFLGLKEGSRQIVSGKDRLILSATSIVNKQNGFWGKRINEAGDPELLTMGNYIYNIGPFPYLKNTGMYPLKAKDADKFIVMRMSATESPNFFYTSDFKNFKQLTHLYPEKAYNWHTTELHTYKMNNGEIGQGVLYKPENFDPAKKHPVIFHYYEKKSFSLNEYLIPENIERGGNINIPTYVSNGYLVFCPDISYKVGDPMQGALDAVASAANYVSKLPYIDAKKMGIQGFSLGGIETNFIVTHTNLFTAACSAGSVSNFVSEYNQLPTDADGDFQMQDFFEVGALRMGKTLWETPGQYIKNSSVFYADKVTTPLLMMQTTHDGICFFPQAIELFMALRRLGKKVWLLEYTEGKHGVLGQSAVDFGKRMEQFFDHYLKDKPAPVWMTRGIPAKLKGIEKGFEYDSIIKTPGPGLLTPQEQRKVDSLLNVQHPILTFE